MNARIVSILLLVACLGLGGALYWVSDRARKDREAAAAKADQLSADLIRSSTQLGEQVKEKGLLEAKLQSRIEEVGQYSNKLQFIEAELAKTEAEAKAAAEKALKEIEEKEKAISGLKAEKDDLTQRMEEMTRRLAGVQAQIQETERRLASSEGDREILKKELRRLLAEKADLEKRYNDLATLRDQMRKLREEAYVARRMEIIRKGAIDFDRKGALLIQQGVRRAPATNAAPVDSSLDVEFRTDGSSRVREPRQAP